MYTVYTYAPSSFEMCGATCGAVETKSAAQTSARPWSELDHAVTPLCGAEARRWSDLVHARRDVRRGDAIVVCGALDSIAAG